MKYSLKISLYLVLFCLLSSCNLGKQEQTEERNLIFLSAQDTQEQIIKKAAHVSPSSRQLEWQKLEYTAFVHFGLYTYEIEGELISPDSFNPVEMDCRQWAKASQGSGYERSDINHIIKSTPEDYRFKGLSGN